ncbi:pentapeptide repeat-containing protein, partial [Streptomyces sp. NPDC002845]
SPTLRTREDRETSRNPHRTRPLETAAWLNIKLRGANLRGANLYRANLFRTDLREAVLREVLITEAIMEQAFLRGTFLEEAVGLTPEQVVAAYPSSTTRLPEALADIQEVQERIVDLEMSQNPGNGEVGNPEPGRDEDRNDQ